MARRPGHPHAHPRSLEHHRLRPPPRPLLRPPWLPHGPVQHHSYRRRRHHHRHRRVRRCTRLLDQDVRRPHLLSHLRQRRKRHSHPPHHAFQRQPHGPHRPRRPPPGNRPRRRRRCPGLSPHRRPHHSFSGGVRRPERLRYPFPQPNGQTTLLPRITTYVSAYGPFVTKLIAVSLVLTFLKALPPCYAHPSVRPQVRSTRSTQPAGTRTSRVPHSRDRPRPPPPLHPASNRRPRHHPHHH